jgi:DNA-binding CsgD family transcriptional regulator
MWLSKRSASQVHLRRLCTLALPMEAVVPALIRTLCRETLCDAGVVLWFDNHGEVANLYTRHVPEPAAMAAWFRPPPEPANVVRLLPATADREPPGGYVETCTNEDDEPAQHDARSGSLCPNRHLCGMAGPAGVPLQRLCCVVTRQGVRIASLMVYRPAAMAPFGREERVLVKAAGRYLSLNGQGLRAETSAAMYHASGEQGFLLCESDGRVIRASANGYELLAQASGCAISRKTVPEELERAGRQLLRRLLDQEATHSSHCAEAAERTTTLINAWGLFRLQAFFEGDGPHGVLIERVEHLLVRLAEAMRHLDLSVQQGEALLLLAQGLSHDRIAERMRVSPNTADYHIRQLYSKLNAHARNEAIAYALEALETARAA